MLRKKVGKIGSRKDAKAAKGDTGISRRRFSYDKMSALLVDDG
jgi:hypothetical protein